MFLRRALGVPIKDFFLDGYELPSSEFVLVMGLCL